MTTHHDDADEILNQLTRRYHSPLIDTLAVALDQLRAEVEFWKTRAVKAETELIQHTHGDSNDKSGQQTA